MRLEKDENKQLTTTAIILSVVLHLFVLVLFISLEKIYPTWMEKLGVKQILPLDKNQSYIIADIMPPDSQARPDKADYIGEYDSKVPKEMIAERFGRTTKMGDGRKKTSLKDSKKTKDSKKEADKTEKKDLFAIGDMYKPKQNIAEKGAEFQKGLEGEALPEDYYPDYRRGPHTFLNVLRYPNISYFVMMKRKFKMTFNPGPSLGQYFAVNRIIQGNVDVVLGVTLNSYGELTELFVFKSSGIVEYDNEAMRTVRASSNFPAPPKEFLEDGALRMSWTFTTYL